MYHWIYDRLGVSVGASDADLMAELDRYADRAIIGGRAHLTAEHRDGIRAEHRDARELYGAVMGGRL